MVAVQAALEPWFVPVLVAGAGLFVLGTVGFAAGIIRSGQHAGVDVVSAWQW